MNFIWRPYLPYRSGWWLKLSIAAYVIWYWNISAENVLIQEVFWKIIGLINMLQQITYLANPGTSSHWCKDPVDNHINHETALLIAGQQCLPWRNKMKNIKMTKRWHKLWPWTNLYKLLVYIVTSLHPINTLIQFTFLMFNCPSVHPLKDSLGYTSN